MTPHKTNRSTWGQSTKPCAARCVSVSKVGTVIRHRSEWFRLESATPHERPVSSPRSLNSQEGLAAAEGRAVPPLGGINRLVRANGTNAAGSNRAAANPLFVMPPVRTLGISPARKTGFRETALRSCTALPGHQIAPPIRGRYSDSILTGQGICQIRGRETGPGLHDATVGQIAQPMIEQASSPYGDCRPQFTAVSLLLSGVALSIGP